MISQKKEEKFENTQINYRQRPENSEYNKINTKSVGSMPHYSNITIHVFSNSTQRHVYTIISNITSINF